MGVTYLSRPLVDHPITNLVYDLRDQNLSCGGFTLQVRSLVDVEKSIDRVFQWLENQGRSAEEIEKLAPYFGVVWPSAVALIAYLRDWSCRQNFAGKSVLELGCGLALPSIVLAKLGARVTASDTHPNVPYFLDINVALNEPCHLSFRAARQMDESERSSERFDWIIGSDILYEKRLVAHFVNEITKISFENTKIVIADPGRPYIQEFSNIMVATGWKSETQAWSVHLNGKDHDIFIMIFSR